MVSKFRSRTPLNAPSGLMLNISKLYSPKSYWYGFSGQLCGAYFSILSTITTPFDGSSNNYDEKQDKDLHSKALSFITGSAIDLWIRLNDDDIISSTFYSGHMTLQK